MGQTTSIHVEVDMRNPGSLQVLAEERPYVVRVRGPQFKDHYCTNAAEVRKLMVPSGEVSYGPYVPNTVRPLLYV